MHFVDREWEVSSLRSLAVSGKPELALLTGRRRVGKSYLLTHAWGDLPFFIFTASRTTPEINRRQLLEDLSVWLNQEVHPDDYPTWRSVFRLLMNPGTPQLPIIILDEFQYLADESSGLAEVASELNAVWERPGKRSPVVLVLAGSAVGTMEGLTAGGGPLYGRFTWRHQLKPFGYRHTAEMVPFSSIRDRCLTYGIFGGTPQYLSLINHSRRLTTNVEELMLSPTGDVRLLIESALDQEEGLRDTSKYRGILQAIASGSTLKNEIAQRSGLDNDSALRDKLERLIEMGYVESHRNFDAKSNEPHRYRVSDHAFRFHQRFVAPSASMLQRYTAGEVWNARIKPLMDSYAGHIFERIAIEGYDEKCSALGLPLVQTWGRWEGSDRSRKSVEIDLVARLEDGRMMTGSVKWNRKPVDDSIHWNHMDRLRRLADSGHGWAHEALAPTSVLYYVSAAGFTDRSLKAIESADHKTACWNLEDLYEVGN